MQEAGEEAGPTKVRCGHGVVPDSLLSVYEISFYVRVQEHRFEGLALLVTSD